MPIKEKTRVVAFAGTEIEYLPSASVVVPIAVPFATTVTEGRVPSPSTEEVTVPVITLACAISAEAPSTRKAKNKSNFFISFTFRLVIEKKYCYTGTEGSKPYIAVKRSSNLSMANRLTPTTKSIICTESGRGFHPGKLMAEKI